MIPLLIVSKSDKELEDYIAALLKKHSISSHYVFHIYPNKTEITIDQIRSIQKEVNIADTHTKLFIIHDFNTAGTEAQNAFLKTLEERSTANAFILLTPNEHQVLPTIKSRTKTIQLRSTPQQDSQSVQTVITYIDSLIAAPSYGFLGETFFTITTKEKALVLFDSLIIYFRTELTHNPSTVEIIKKIISIKSLLMSNNLNPQLAVDNALIFIYRYRSSLANTKKRSNN